MQNKTYSKDKRRPNKGKGNRNKRKESNYKDEEMKKDGKSNANINMNDPNWYFRDPIMKSGLTRMPTFEFLGQDIHVDCSVENDITDMPDLDCDITSPTLAVHYLNPSPGISKDNTSAINMASKMLYSKLSSSNAKTSNYAPQDIAMLILQLGEVISMINHLTRVYGVTNYYSKMNRAVPSVFLQGFNIPVSNQDEWIRLLPQFRAELNQAITVANSITFPDNLPYFKKCAYVYQHIFTDNTTEMTGYHMFAPYSTWKINETDYDQGTILKTVRLQERAGAAASPNAILSELKGMINALLTSLTYNYIYADVINLLTRGALGSNLLSFGTVPIDYFVEPIHSDQFNWQLINAHWYGSPNNGSLTTDYTPNNDVYPVVNTNSIKYVPAWTNSSTAGWWLTGDFHKPIIRVPGVGISEDDLIECLVYSGVQKMKLVAGTAPNVSVTVFAEGDIPDHYLVSSSIFRGDPNTNTMNPIRIQGIVNNYTPEGSMITALAGEFEHFPLIHSYNSYATLTSGYNTPINHRIYGRLNCYTTDMVRAINNIRFASYLGLFTEE